MSSTFHHQKRPPSSSLHQKFPISEEKIDHTLIFDLKNNNDNVIHHNNINILGDNETNLSEKSDGKLWKSKKKQEGFL